MMKRKLFNRQQVQRLQRRGNKQPELQPKQILKPPR